MSTRLRFAARSSLEAHDTLISHVVTEPSETSPVWPSWRVDHARAKQAMGRSLIYLNTVLAQHGRPAESIETFRPSCWQILAEPEVSRRNS